MQVVINCCYGGFSLSKDAQDLYCAWMKIDPGAWNKLWEYYTDFHVRDLCRADPVLVAVVDYLGEEASTKFSDLKIVDIPDDVEWTIEEYDGSEWVAEKHRTWR